MYKANLLSSLAVPYTGSLNVLIVLRGLIFASEQRFKELFSIITTKVKITCDDKNNNTMKDIKCSFS